jgi:hypothetical protein
MLRGATDADATVFKFVAFKDMAPTDVTGTIPPWPLALPALARLPAGDGMAIASS